MQQPITGGKYRSHSLDIEAQVVPVARTKEHPLITAARYVFLPAVAPGAIAGLYFTPVSLFGCANRGLLAIGVAALALLTAFVLTFRAVRLRRKGARDSGWLILSAVILITPALLLIGPLG